MSRQAHELPSSKPYKVLIHEAYLELGAPKVRRFYRRYTEFCFGLGWGGDDVTGEDGFRKWMAGDTEPRASEFALVCRFLNEFLVEGGKEPKLPDLPLPVPYRGDGGERSTEEPPADIRYFRQTPITQDLRDLQAVV